MNATEFRLAAAEALTKIREVHDGDWTVMPTWYDAIQPPAFVLRWGPSPWRIPQTWCQDLAALEVVCVSARLTPEANLPLLEHMVGTANDALMDARMRPVSMSPPGAMEVAQIMYLAAPIQLQQPVAVGQTPLEPPEPPPTGDAVWAGWGERTPADVAGSGYLTVPGDPMFLGGATATGMEYVAQQPGTVEGLRFWRHGSDPTTSRRLGMWWWLPDSQELGHRTVATDSEAEGWVTVAIDPPVALSTVDELHQRFIALAEVPLGSGFYFSPWNVSATELVKHQRSRGRPLGQWPPPTGLWPEWPPPDVYPSGSAPGITIGDTVWVDVLYRPSQ